MSGVKKKSAKSSQMHNKSNELLQDFVDHLLTEPDSLVSFENLDMPKVEETPVSRSGSISFSSAAGLIKPLLSERLKTAQNLLKDIPLLHDKETTVNDKEVILNNEDVDNQLEENPLRQPELDTIKRSEPVKEINFPQLLTRPVLPIFETINDDIEIVFEEETDLKIVNSEEIEAVAKLQGISNYQIGKKFKNNIKEETTSTITTKIKQKTFTGPPAWGKEEFQALTFNIGELKLAVPLIKLGGIHRLAPEPTPLAGRPPWYLGLVAGEYGNISLIDTALWIMPEKYEIAKAKGLDYEYIVLLDETQWGLACSSVDDALTVTEDKVKWTPKGSKRPWLAGMMVDEMCALLDVDSLIEMLDDLSEEAVQ